MKQKNTNHLIIEENIKKAPVKIKKAQTSNQIKIKQDLCDDITTTNLPSSLKEVEIQIDRLKQRWNEFTYLIGQRLKYINDNRLFEQSGYTDFSTYVNVALKMSENNAYYYIAIFDYFTEEQTVLAGSKLKLIIPVLNKIKKDKTITDSERFSKLEEIKNELFTKIYNRTYREAEKIIEELRLKYFDNKNSIDELSFKDEEKKIAIRGNKIIIFEEDKNIQKEIVDILEQFYLNSLNL